MRPRVRFDGVDCSDEVVGVLEMRRTLAMSYEAGSTAFAGRPSERPQLLPHPERASHLKNQGELETMQVYDSEI